MKVAIVSVFPPYRGGIAQFNERLVEALEACGHQVIRINFSRQYPSLLFPGKSQYSDAPVKDPAPRLLDSVSPISWLHTANAVNQAEPDRVLIPYWTAYLAPALAAVAKRCNAPVTGLLHNAIPHDAGKVQRLLGPRFLSACDDFITLSEAVTQDLLSVRRDAQVVTLFHPVYDHFGALLDRAKARDVLQIDAEKKTLLFFGLIRPYKGLDVLIKAFRELPDDYQLLIAGEAYEKTDTYQALAEPVAERVKWSDGFVPDNEMPVWFSAADAVVLPYREATQSGVTAAAFHFNKPVISSDVGALSESIDQGVTGMLVEPGSAAALKEAIQNWFSVEHPKTVSAIEAHCEAYSWNNFVEQWMSEDVSS